MVHYGRLTIPSATGDQVISGITGIDGSTTFTPKFILFWSSKVPSAGSLDFDYFTVGMTDGTRQVTRGFFGNIDGVVVAGTTQAAQAEAYSESKCIWFKKYISGVPPDPVVFSDVAASITSVGDGTFTITWSDVDNNADLVHFLAVGGEAVQCRVDTFTAPSSAGAQTQTVTGPGFKPTGLITIGPMTDQTEVWNQSTTNGCRMGAFGYVSNALVNQSSSSFSACPTDGTITATSMCRSAAWNEYEMDSATARPPMITGSIQSFDTNGFTVNWSVLTSNGAGVRVPYCAFTGIAMYVGRIFCPSASGTQTTAGVGFAPEAATFQTLGYFASPQLNLDPPKQPNRYSIGCAMNDSGPTQGTASVGDASNQATPYPTITARALSTSKCILDITPADDGTAAITTMDAGWTTGTSDGFTLTWDHTFENAEVFVAAFGSSAVGPNPPPPPPPPTPPPPVPTGTVRNTRRVRRFPLPFNQNQWVFFSRLEILIQSGVGLVSGQGSDPILMCRFSKDGGNTWTPELQMGMGKIGEYNYRAYLNRLGRGRNWVVELSTSDPVFVALIDSFADLEGGLS